MDTNTGRIYELGEDFDLEHIKRIEAGPGRQLPQDITDRQPAFTVDRYGSTFIHDELGSRVLPPTDGATPPRDRLREHAELAQKALGRDLSADEIAALRDALGGATIVPVSEQVAQTVRLGEREQDRRRRRRKAAKRARRGNR